MKKPIIGIIGGRGKMGSYFADFFERNKFEVIVSDQRTELDNKEVAKRADVVIVSVPIDRTQEVILEVAPHVKKSGLLMDFTSVKAMPMEAMKKTKASYLGCHPLFGPTASIRGQIVILCVGRGMGWHRWFKNLLEENSVLVRELTARKHDELMAYIQTLTHFSHIAFADTLRKSGISINEFIKYPSPVYMMELYMMGRILNQDSKLYANIQLANPVNVKAVESYLRSCRELAETIERKKFKDNVDFFKKNTEYLGHFATIAMDESDNLLRYLKLPQKSRFFARSPKPKKSDVALLGPPNTFSDQVLKRYRLNENPWYAASIAEVFELILDGKVKAGLVPIENSSTGSIRETLDELYENDVHISEVMGLPVKLALAGTIKCQLKKVKTIYSHAQALLQCRHFIRKNCPDAALIPMSSTTAALERMFNEDKEGTVAIVSPEAAETYHLKIIRDSIEDEKENITYFAYIIKGQPNKLKTDAKKTSVAFHFKKDSPGSLNSVLQTFAEAGINLAKIESRPSVKIPGDYV
ncbi:MAG: prephenate dehydrogenase/arogenate dehydrogenase family protein, partial [Patescibacteria group bacterium]